MRRLKWAKAYLEENQLYKDPSIHKGRWKKSLGVDEIHVEIGSGKGDYFIGMSKIYPHIGWIGVEKNESVAALALRKAHSENVQKNTSFIYQDAKNLEEWFMDGEIHTLHLNFSDPWPKNRTSKRRLSHVSFLEKYYRLLDKQGEIQMKTDNRSLFEYSLVSFSNHKFLLKEVYLDFRADIHDEDVISEYEKKFMEKGNPIYRAVFIKDTGKE
ncbi:MAG: tRNA (guanosine(46)-N7)-methyltransferase TrmB [Breznakia sp.]